MTSNRIVEFETAAVSDFNGMDPIVAARVKEAIAAYYSRGVGNVKRLRGFHPAWLPPSRGG